jgi:hypothetical protein
MSKKEIKSIIESVQIITVVQYNDYLKKSSKEIHDVFSYNLRPADNVYPEVNLREFCNSFIADDLEWCDECDIEEYKQKYEHDRVMALKTIDYKVKNVVVHINYPVTNPACFKFNCENISVTYGMVLYLYTYAYQLMYKLEDEECGPTPNIPGMINRGKSDGQFGIWGYDIGDLVYNGSSLIHVCDDTVVCYFSCDS